MVYPRHFYVGGFFIVNKGNYGKQSLFTPRALSSQGIEGHVNNVNNKILYLFILLILIL